MVAKKEVKKRVMAATVTATLHDWMKENVENVSAFIDHAFLEHSRSVASSGSIKV